MASRLPGRRLEIGAALRAKFVERVERYGPAVEIVGDGNPPLVHRNPSVARLEALHAGLPLEVYAHEIARFLTPEEKAQAGRWRVLADGTIERTSINEPLTP
jgi:hypothetical protein